MTAGRMGAFIIYLRITFHQQQGTQILKRALLGQRENIFIVNIMLSIGGHI